ncbi:HoxN/HupN/NixA family nickel/cobalt transporter [Fructobacillus sp. M1-13]|uniref:Nickel/cobalt efflux system n=1 Tax=Fructobacillus papyriferae TaxID=2713171 RepID=A0ABS5QQ59_9LACO|nr:HoxN/HupN/NixA family nickel/cobalt transporter [Fructobacillus papyriferae]MBS9335062.1 HoxN/HupN/NixA family nickel/cobalt transporter [Fructobacillus papyriferae]MCD2159452.1 HoxN/HupN/NixA family nickel/cobalt transporter [Fructobacillus papyriferae]
MTEKQQTVYILLKYGVVIGLIGLFGTLFLSTGVSAYPPLGGMCFLAFTFGLRHAFDIDHIAAIDNMTRKMLHEGRKKTSIGFAFSLGHSSVVLLLTILTVCFVDWAKKALPDFEAVGGIVGTSIAATLLLILALANTSILFGIWRQFKMLRQGGDQKTSQKLAEKSFVYRLFQKFLSLIHHDWQVALVGFLFGLGFDTATQVAVLATSATAATAGVPWYATLSVPLFFTVGMCTLDTLDGFFMSHAYSWMIASSFRKVYFNLVMTAISVLAAAMIAGVDFVQVLHAAFGWENSLIEHVSALDFNQLGIVLVSLFAFSWLIALTYWHYSGLEKVTH